MTHGQEVTEQVVLTQTAKATLVAVTGLAVEVLTLPVPFGLGDDPATINAILEERTSAEARASDPKPLNTAGGDRRSIQASLRSLNSYGEGADDLTARIARDRPDVLAMSRRKETPPAGIDAPFKVRCEP